MRTKNANRNLKPEALCLWTAARGRKKAGPNLCIAFPLYFHFHYISVDSKHMLEGSHNANELGKRPRYSTRLSASVDSSAVSMIPVSVDYLDGEEEQRKAAPSGKEQVPISTDVLDDEDVTSPTRTLELIASYILGIQSDP